MNICITSQANNLDSLVDSRFGRAQFFIIVDTDTLKFEVIENPNITGSGGVGIKSAQLMLDKGVEVVLTGNVGPNAFKTLEAAQIKVISGVSGKVKDAIDEYNKGTFKVNDSHSVDSHFGTK